jgi:hypothetical protein
MAQVVCCGPTITPRKYDARAAEARGYEWFRQDFEARFPNGETMTQLEYIGETDSSRRNGGKGRTPVQFGKAFVDACLREMSDSFNRDKPGSFKKPDGIGLTEVLRHARMSGGSQFVLILPDGSKSLIPTDWTDFEAPPASHRILSSSARWMTCCVFAGLSMRSCTVLPLCR